MSRNNGPRILTEAWEQLVRPGMKYQIKFEDPKLNKRDDVSSSLLAAVAQADALRNYTGWTPSSILREPRQGGPHPDRSLGAIGVPGKRYHNKFEDPKLNKKDDVSSSSSRGERSLRGLFTR